VINADDLGLHEAINEGIVLSHQRGIVTSASIVPCGIAFNDALARLKTCPALAVGVHLTLVEERPILPQELIPSLVNKSGAMPSNYAAFAQRWLIGRIREEDVVNELEAQINRVLSVGITPSHLDSHQHVHCLPGIWGIVMRLAKKYRVRYLRLPHCENVLADATLRESFLRMGVNVLSVIRRFGGSKDVRHADFLRGFAHSGRMTSERLLAILQSLECGVTEVMVHPKASSFELKERYRGWPRIDWESDLKALVDGQVVRWCRSGKVHLTNFTRLNLP
jgi:predicted glycoside hydrolase/deacetylase ChbG (UPF0249 family)